MVSGMWEGSEQISPAVAGGRATEAFLFLCLFVSKKKIKVSGRGFDSRWPHSVCETVIAVHMVK